MDRKLESINNTVYTSYNVTTVKYQYKYLALLLIPFAIPVFAYLISITYAWIIDGYKKQ